MTKAQPINGVYTVKYFPLSPFTLTVMGIISENLPLSGLGGGAGQSHLN